MRLELHAGGRRRQQAPALPFQIQILVNVPAHHGIHFRITQQDRAQHMRVAQAVLIEPGATGRQRMMVQQQQRIALGVSLQAALHPLELVFAQFAVRYAEHLAVQHQHLPAVAQQHLFEGAMPAAANASTIAG